MSQISAFNKKLKDLITQAKRYESTKNLKKAVKAWIGISEFCLNFIKRAKVDISFKNMIIKKTKDIITHVKSLKQAIYQKEQKWTARDDEKISEIMQNLPETPSDIPESEDMSDDEFNVRDDLASSDQKVLKKPDGKDVPKGVVEINPRDYNFHTIIPGNESRKPVSRNETPDKNRKPIAKPVIENKKLGFACPFCGEKIGHEDKVCSQCGSSLD